MMRAVMKMMRADISLHASDIRHQQHSVQHNRTTKVLSPKYKIQIILI